MLEFYLWGVLASAIITAAITYFDTDDITVEGLLCSALIVMLSWAGVALFVLYFLCEGGPNWVKENVDLKKVVYKRRRH